MSSPATQSWGSGPSSTPSSRTSGLSSQQPRVLVVEDEESLHALLQYNLEKEGFSVDVAVDGEEALMMIDERAPDIVILDWMLPKVSGIEVCRRLRGRA